MTVLYTPRVGNTENQSEYYRFRNLEWFFGEMVLSAENVSFECLPTSISDKKSKIIPMKCRVSIMVPS